MKKKILVTGGAGFIGSHLCERLSQDEHHKVYSLDNYFTGSKKNHIKNVTYIDGDTSDINKLIKFEPHTIYHLGEYSRVEQSFDDIEKVWEFNKNGTFAVLEFTRKCGAKIVYAGSSTKFGDGGLGRKQSPYGWTKATNTKLVENYGAWYSVPYAITYFYNVSGNSDYRRNFMKRKCTNEQIVRGMKIMEQSTIEYSVNNIIGMPDETREMIFDTIEINRKFIANSYSVLIFQPFRGTWFYNYCVEKGYYDKETFATGTTSGPVIKNPHLTDSEIMGLYKTFNLYIKLPKEDWPLIKRAEIDDDEGNRIFEQLMIKFKKIELEHEKILENKLKHIMPKETYEINQKFDANNEYEERKVL